MKITVDHTLCSGHGRCASVAPSVYALDAMGNSAITELEVPPGLEADARRGADNCPERAITLTG